jgi:hypothetical protein
MLGMTLGELSLNPRFKVHMLALTDKFLGGFLAYPVRRTARLLELS